MPQTEELFVKMILSAWESQNAKTTKLFDNLTDEQLLSEVSPGRNRGVYLLGHLVAVNDELATILDIGEKRFPEYEDIFLEKPDKSGSALPDTSTLRENWKQVSQRLKEYFRQLKPDDWFLRHTKVSEADFIKEPHRNKLNVLITRTNHEASHHGQLLFLQKK